MKYINNTIFKSDSRFLLPKINENIFKRNNFALFANASSNPIENVIYNQLRYVPPAYARNLINKKTKVILVYDLKEYIPLGDFQVCPVSNCRFSLDRNMLLTADVVLYIAGFPPQMHKQPINQAWALIFLESPFHTPSVFKFETYTKSKINWTLTYRPDSTIPYPYHMYTPFNLVDDPPDRYPLPKRNYAQGKTKLAAWFVSNCNAANDRYQVVKNLQKYIQVDSYGSCGQFSCPRNMEKICFDILNKTYKFYLSFENSYCRHYITEKFFKNGLSYDVIPVVLGAHPDDYKRVAPPHSYIHVDDFDTIKDLADYLKYLDKNDTAYNEYFAWKPFGTVHFNHHYYCRLCMMAHLSDEIKIFNPNIHKWWHGDNNDFCFRSGKWKNHKTKV